MLDYLMDGVAGALAAGPQAVGNGMAEALPFLAMPFLACLAITGIHVYLRIHIGARDAAGETVVRVDEGTHFCSGGGLEQI